MEAQILTEAPIQLFWRDYQQKFKTVHETNYLPLSPPGETNKFQPLLRKTLQSYPKLDSKLCKRGYKYFTKVIISGSKTVEALRAIKSSSQIKFIKRFEFDPYFSHSPATRELIAVLPKLFSVKDLKVVIRRLDSPWSAHQIGLYVKKFLRVQRLCLQNLTVPDIEEYDLMHMIYNFLRCYSISYLELHLVNLVVLSQHSCHTVAKKWKSLYKMQDAKIVARYTHSRHKFYEDKLVNFPKIRNLKRFKYLKGSDADWTAMTDGKSVFLASYMKTFGGCQNLVEFSYKLEKVNFTTEILLALTQGLSEIPTLRFFSLELQKCNLGELEIMVLAYGISQIPQLESVVIRLRQKSLIEIEWVCSFTQHMCQIKNLKRLEFCFRRVRFSEIEKEEAKKSLSAQDNLQFTISNQTVNICRFPLDALKDFE